MTHRIVLGAIASAALIASTVGCAGSTPSGLRTTTTTTVTAPPTAAGTPAGYALLDVQIDNGTVTPVNTPLRAEVGQRVVVQINQHRKTEDIALADQIVPRVR